MRWIQTARLILFPMSGDYTDMTEFGLHERLYFQ